MIYKLPVPDDPKGTIRTKHILTSLDKTGMLFSWPQWL